ncbi:hypothetical protein [Nocardia anaemiae]|uniref:hypothetical protein n=1 Tax=Nocardia anaemiae TaxID=263910 RepID=UPI000A00EC21|nr:hypothetical protein [Nocardia anaemiae]
MARISDGDKTRNEQSIRAAMDRLLSGDLPPGRRCDLKSLAAEAGVTRTGFYPKKNRDGSSRPGPYQHLADEFERRLHALQNASAAPDPRVQQIERLKNEVGNLKARVARRDVVVAELQQFKSLAISRLAAQHDEITQLRAQLEHPHNVSQLR